MCVAQRLPPMSPSLLLRPSPRPIFHPLQLWRGASSVLTWTHDPAERPILSNSQSACWPWPTLLVPQQPPTPPPLAASTAELQVLGKAHAVVGAAYAEALDNVKDLGEFHKAHAAMGALPRG
jgi:hypothetical protein